jgi:hypothetical protein
MNAVPELMFTMLPPPCARITGITACIATIGPNTLVEDFIKKRGLDLLDCRRVATSCIIHEPVDAAIMLMHSAYGFPHTIKPRHVYRDRQALWKLLRHLLKRIAAACQQGHSRAAVR